MRLIDSVLTAANANYFFSFIKFDFKLLFNILEFELALSEIDVSPADHNN